jgi:hypothetical protein
MQRLLPFLFLFPFAVSTVFGQDNAAESSTITFGVGGGWTGRNPLGTAGGPVFNGTYEFRIWKYLALEAGVHNTLVTANQLIGGNVATILAGTNLLTVYTSPSLTSRGEARNTSVPVGFRGILPLRQGKVELFLGGDGAYIWNANQGYRAWAVEGRLGVRFAVDKQRRFWLGTSGEYSREFGLYPQNLTNWTADFGYRFGSN